MIIDVTDATLQSEVVERSLDSPVVIDLWAPWCGPCKTLGPILEDVVARTNGEVVLAKINVDENPVSSQMFQVQGIPAVYAMKGGKIVNGFVGAQPQNTVEAFVNSLIPTDEDRHLATLLKIGDEASLRELLTIDPGHEPAILKLAELLVDDARNEEALEFLARIPETGESRRIAALARTGGDQPGDIEARLTSLLERVKADEEARKEFLDLLEVLGPDDPRTAQYRKQLTARLY